LTTSDELARRYSELMAGLDGLLSMSDGEVIGVLHQNEWLRILLVRGSEDEAGGETSITVELSLSRCTSDSGGGNTSPDGLSYHDADCFLTGMIRHLEYLRSLAQHGFSLNVIREDCLWAATLPTPELPDKAVFRALVPPT
jgi:hypothetical protein